MRTNKRALSSANKMTKLITGTGKDSLKKIKASIIAIILGLLIGVIPIVLENGNPFNAYKMLLTGSFNSLQIGSLISTSSVFILLAVGMGISFKAGLFNIGAAGQFMLSGAVTVIIGIKIHASSRALSIPILILISMLVGALTAGFIGFLKAYFNVHEVVSTILLNWELFYIIKYIFQSPGLQNPQDSSSFNVADSMRLSPISNSFDMWIILSIAIVMAISIWILFKFTTFGHSLKVNGKSSEAAKYSGINTKFTTITAMSLSGALCGLAGFIYYSCIRTKMPSFGISGLPVMPFEAIAIALLAFSSPIGAIPAGLFYGLIKHNLVIAGLAGGVDEKAIAIALGTIILMSALAPILEHYHPIKTFYRNIKFHIKKEHRDKRKLIYQKMENFIKTERPKMNKLNIAHKKEAVAIAALHSKWAKEMRRANTKTKKILISVKYEKLIGEFVSNKKFYEFKQYYKISLKNIIDELKLYKQLEMAKVSELKAQRRSAIWSARQAKVDLRSSKKAMTQSLKNELATKQEDAVASLASKKDLVKIHDKVNEKLSKVKENYKLSKDKLRGGK